MFNLLLCDFRARMGTTLRRLVHRLYNVWTLLGHYAFPNPWQQRTPCDDATNSRHYSFQVIFQLIFSSFRLIVRQLWFSCTLLEIISLYLYNFTSEIYFSIIYSYHRIQQYKTSLASIEINPGRLWSNSVYLISSKDECGLIFFESFLQ